MSMSKTGLFLLSLFSISSAACTTARTKSLSSTEGLFTGSLLHVSSKTFTPPHYLPAVLRVKACTATQKPDLLI
jgi:hypothetical protein